MDPAKQVLNSASKSHQTAIKRLDGQTLLVSDTISLEEELDTNELKTFDGVGELLELLSGSLMLS